nr:hypothetical protein Iba_chr08dCG1900 [Ipomoea batatas]
MLAASLSTNLNLESNSVPVADFSSFFEKVLPKSINRKKSRPNCIDPFVKQSVMAQQIKVRGHRQFLLVSRNPWTPKLSSIFSINLFPGLHSYLG